MSRPHMTNGAMRERIRCFHHNSSERYRPHRSLCYGTWSYTPSGLLGVVNVHPGFRFALPWAKILAALRALS